MFVCNAIKNFSDGKGVTCPHCGKPVSELPTVGTQTDTEDLK